MKLTRRYWHEEGTERFIKISLCNRMSLVSMLHHKDRSVPSSCQITPLQVSYFSLYFVIFPYFLLFFTFSSIVTKFVVSKYSLFSIIILTSFIITFSSLLLIYLLLFSIHILLSPRCVFQYFAGKYFTQNISDSSTLYSNC